MEGARLGPYQLLGELGSGGMGRVYRAEVADWVPGLEPGCVVALKLIHAHLLETPGFFQRFLREADIGRSVEHEGVVRTYLADALLHEGTSHHFLVMEYVEGQTLRDLLGELERVPEELCRHIGREIARGLQAIHEAGVIHRDLKPENVLITEEHVVKIMDLGVARLQDEAIRLSQTGAFVGSLEYACPEQFRSGGSELDGRSDLHALGVVLYELSTGRHPYRDDDALKVLRNILDVIPRKAGEVNPQLSPFFEEVVQTLLAKEQAQRFPAASDLLGVLEEGEKSDWWRERAKALRIETKRPLRRVRIPRETALYGRDDDLAKLKAAYAEAQAGEGRVLLIEGEAGIGKTRLVDEFVGLLRQDGEDLSFLFGSCPPGGAATAAGAFSTAYREHFGVAGLDETLKDYLKPTPSLVPAFAAVLRGEPAPEGKEPLTQDSLQTVFVHATRALAAERTTIVLVDDLHFAPEDGRALFTSLAMAAPGHRILLLGTMRPGVPEAWTANLTRLEHAEQRSLARLGPKDLGRLLRDAFRSDRLADELGWRIAEKSDGNPFFAFEIIRGLREGQFIAQQPDGTWVTTKVIQDIQVPSSVLDLVNARVGDLNDDERNFLDVASCLGFAFDSRVVADVLGLARIPALQMLARIEKRHRLVRSSGDGFLFDHHQVQEALYGALSKPLREAYHAAIAEALEAQGRDADAAPEDVDGALTVALCTHFLKGARGDRALRYLTAALVHLEQGFLNAEAVVLADRALEVEDLLEGERRVEILLQRNDRLERLGRREEQAAGLEEAHTLAEKGGKPALVARVRRAMGNLYLRTDRYTDAREHYEHSLAIARELGDRRGEARAISNLGSVLWSLGRFEEARPHYEKCIEIASEIGDHGAEAGAAGNLGSVLWALSRYEEALTHQERSLSIARAAGDRQIEAIATGQLGSSFQVLGRCEEAQPHFEAWLRIAREIGDRRGEARASGGLGWVLLSLGRSEESGRHFEQYLEIAREIGDRQGEGQAFGNLGSALLSQGHYEEARQHFERHLDVAHEIGDRRGEALASGNLGIVQAKLGRHEEARAHLDHSLQIARETGDRQAEGRAIGVLGMLFMSLGHYEEVRSHLEQHLDIAREIGDRQGVASALVNLGPLWLALGDPVRARSALEASLTICREIGSRYTEGYALGGLADVAHEEEDENTQASDLTTRALALRREIGHRDGVANSLVKLGDLYRQAGDHDAAQVLLEEAVDLLREQQRKGGLARALALLACLPDGDVTVAEAAAKDAGDAGNTPSARYHLWKATGKHEHLAEAKRLLDHRVEHAPEECRASMLENVRLNREIVAAWEKHGGEGEDVTTGV